MAAPATIHPILMRTTTDCMIASLATVLGLDYLAVQSAASKLYVVNWEKGLSCVEAVRVAKALKHPLKLIQSRAGEEFDEPLTAILVVRRGNTYHALVLFYGALFDPSDGTLWEPTAYFHTTKRTPYKLLVP